MNDKRPFVKKESFLEKFLFFLLLREKKSVFLSLPMEKNMNPCTTSSKHHALYQKHRGLV